MKQTRERKRVIFFSFHGSLFPINFQMIGRKTTSDESPKKKTFLSQMLKVFRVMYFLFAQNNIAR